ncbi:glycosyltransferase [Phycicoccus sonneratiae]|uniref:Glycosyltransferase n=1 Tax=Phycicoccus sonneratiae TaxID=2807628 RepID=A0ABS2CG45_9MICO|nr:glycosyltransferase [Phycicoccus sonneraticus]MBM6398853.1 glycosyltransferase [Phycicoccus sonneraticus]
MSEPFSLLLPVYRGDRPDHLVTAFRSTVHEQLRRPDEVVVVQDGHVGPELASALERLESGSPVPVRRLRLSHNVGLAQALQCGLAACRHDVVARMDADDISLPHRFLVQLPVVEAGADLVGAAVLEVEDGDVRSGEGGVLRVPPTTPAEIAEAARWRNPFNHPTVVYRRSAVLAAGGYRELPFMEDYWVFARMIANGARVANIAEPLVRYRVDAGSYERKGGVRQLRSELGLQRRLRAEGFTTSGQLVRNSVVRGGYRLVPTALRRRAYRRTFTTTAATATSATELTLPVAPAWHRHPSAGTSAGGRPAVPPVVRSGTEEEA